MSLHSKILVVPAIGAALLIGACGGNHLDAAQAGVVGTEVVTNVVQTLGAANGQSLDLEGSVGVEPTPAAGATTPGGTIGAPGICSEAGVCTLPATTFPCPFSSTAESEGNLSLAGTFDETQATTTLTGIETETITNSAFTVSFANPPTTPLGCSFDDEVILTGGSVAVTQQTGTAGNIFLDQTNDNIELPFTIIVDGTVDYTKGPVASIIPAGSGHCALNNVTITYSLDNPAACPTPTASCAVDAFVASGSVCGHTIPAAGITLLDVFASPNF